MRRIGEVIAPIQRATVTLDTLDRELLTILAINSRTSFSQIAKALGTSPERITYRYNRLVDEKIILDAFAILEPKKLGVHRYCVYLQFHALSKEKMSQIIETFIKNKWINWIIETAGKWELVLMIETLEESKFDGLLAEILSPINNYLNDYAITIVKNFVHKSPRYIGQAKLKEDYLGLITFPYEHEFTNKSEIEVSLDSVDIQLLKILHEDARKPLTEIGKQLKLSHDTVDYRVKKLILGGYIKGFIIRTNYHLLDYQYTTIMLKLRSASVKRKEEFFQTIYKDERFYALMEQIGPWDASLMMFFRQPKDLREFLIEIKEQFSDIIHSHETALHFNQYYYTYLCDGVYEELNEKYMQK